MNQRRAVSILRWTWLLGLVVLIAIIAWQNIYAADDFHRVVGWVGATTGTMAPIVLLGGVRDRRLVDTWPFWVATVLSWVHIGLSLYVLSRIATEFSLVPLDRYQPLYGLLNPLVLAALGYFFFQNRDASMDTPSAGQGSVDVSNTAITS